MTMSATVGSTDGARHMTMIAISQEFEPPRGSSLFTRMFCAFLVSRAAFGAAASSGCCRTVDVRLSERRFSTKLILSVMMDVAGVRHSDFSCFEAVRNDFFGEMAESGGVALFTILW